MKKYLFASIAVAFSILILGASSWAQCPEDTVDRGECDSMTVICLDCEQTPDTGPWHVRFPFLITHDQSEPVDSIAGFVIPVSWTRTNPAKYCSLSAWWNTNSVMYLFPDFSTRSVFRHILNESDPSDTLYLNRMGVLGSDFVNPGREWDTRIIEVSTDPPYGRMSIVATGSQDQRWWEGDRVLLATFTFVIEDTMTVCMDTTFWPPTGHLLWSRVDSKTYVPRGNLPECFTIGEAPPPDFTIEAAPEADTVQPGESADYTVTLTSINGFDSPCTLTVTGLPVGASASFAPNPVTPTNASAMTITTTGATPPGSHEITITADEILPPLKASPGKSPVQVQHSTQVTLVVITPESVAVTAPNGGEDWCTGSAHNITWTSGGIDTVAIDYSTNGGSSWIPVMGKVPAASGSYSWTVPDTPSSNCLVRVCDAEDGTPCDQSDAAFTISAPPADPSGCVASDDLCDKVEFSWTDNSGNEDGFIIYRAGSVLDTVGADVVSYDDLTAASGMTYNYCVSAYNDCGESGQCCESGTRKALPADPSACIASDDLCDKVEFSWTDNSGNEDGFVIYRAGSVLDTVGADVVSYDDLTAVAGMTYNYCVSAYNDCGESGQCCESGTRKASPADPSACIASDDLCDKVEFSWTDNSGNEDGFVIYRAGSALDTVGADVVSYDDLTAAPGVTYNYCVSAYNDCGESGQCCEDGTRKAPPADPSACIASDDLCDKVEFSWTDNSGNEDGFIIYRAGSALDTVGADVVSYDDLTAVAGMTYNYCVSAYNDCGESGQCCENGTRKAPPADPSDCVASDDLCDTVSFSWIDNSGNEDGFIVYRDGSPLDTVAAGVLSFDDLTGTPGVTYEYCVTAYNDCGESGQCCDNGTMVAEAITVTSPDGGENWTVGTSQSITWNDSCIDSVDIEYSTNGGSSWTVEAEGVLAAAGSYSWTVPDAPSTNCLVRICDAEDGSPCDQSDAVFTISTEVVEAVTVTAPNGGEIWCVGSTESITWTSTDIDTVQIEYSTNGGSDWTLEAEKVLAALGTYSWIVPDAPSENCLVRICHAEDFDPCDQSNATFTILALPADPSACVASDDLCDKVEFSWTDNSGNEDGFIIYRAGSALDTVGADVVSYDDLTAVAGMTYNYCVSAYNDCGESGQCCEDGTRKASPADPSACIASDDLCDTVSFSWTDNSGNEDGFIIYRAGSALDTVGTDVVSYDDLTAAPGVTYDYCVSAYNDCGESGQCCESGTRKAVPADPTGCMASDHMCDRVVFCWADLSDDETGFYVYRDAVKIDSVAADTTCYEDFGVSPGMTYQYCVTAFNDCGESGQCCDQGAVTVEAIVLISPNGGENWTVGTTQNITWNDSCIDSVDIEYSTNGGSGWTVEAEGVLAAAGSYSWTVPDAPSTNCLVRICDAEDGSPCDQSDAVFTISTEVVEAVTVTAPNGGEIWCVGSTESITWTSTDIDTVQIEYSTNGGSDWTLEADKVLAAPGTYSWTVPDAPSENCLVRICHAEDFDPCDQSNAAFTILALPADPSACVASDDLCDKVEFSWTDNSGNEDGFIIYREGSVLDTVGTDVVSYDDLTAAPGVTYNYCVSAYNDCGESGQCCDDGIMLTPPAAPTNCDASDLSCDSVQFCWQDNSDDETGFYIYRDGAKLDSVGSNVTCYDDLSATPGTSYEYCVSAYATCGESNQCCDTGTRLGPPADPTGCMASDDDCDMVAFCWADLSDDELGFYIYRDGTKIDSVGVDATCYDDLGAVPGTTYEYCVAAYNDCGESSRCCDNGTVATEYLAVISPNGGENWPVGSTQMIEWACSCLDSVRLEYSTDGGATWTLIASGLPCAKGTYSWTVPDAPSGNCLVRASDASDGDPSDGSDATFTIFPPSEVIYVDFDIKPGSCPNPLNTKSNGVLPVAILGTDDFDVTDIDPATVMLEGVSPLRWNWKDVTRPVTDPTDTCDCTTRGGDGFTDMTLKFETQEIADALEIQMPFADGETRILTVTGMTYAGVPIEGTDCIVIIHKGQTRSSAGDMSGYTLGKNYPNPFNPVTDISFILPERAFATLIVYNVAGKKVTTLVAREMEAGTHTVRWNGIDESGIPVSSGIYFYRLKSGVFDKTMKMVLMK